MIVPIGHDQSIRRWPWVTIGIIAVCTLVQLYSSLVAPIVWRWGYHTGNGFDLTLITSAFVHAGWFHLVGNMLFLWIVGTAVEDRFGPIKFGVFYIAGAIVSTLCFAAMSDQATTVIGASGAISAVMGAFLVYFATTQITFWWWVMRSGTFRTVAYIALPLWFGEQFLWRYIEGPSTYSGVAYEAHIGGFVFGVSVAFAAKLLFRGTPDSEIVVGMPSDDRFVRCMAAIRAGDLAAIRPLASRVIIDLVRFGDNSRALDVYIAMRALPNKPLTDGAFAAAARAAEAIKNPELRDEILADLIATHPGSALARQAI